MNVALSSVAGEHGGSMRRMVYLTHSPEGQQEGWGRTQESRPLSPIPVWVGPLEPPCSPL